MSGQPTTRPAARPTRTTPAPAHDSAAAEAKREKQEEEEQAAQKRAETVSLRAGVLPTYQLTIMPRAEFAFKEPPADVVRMLGSPQKLQFEFPLEGTCKRIGACELGCTVSWLVKREADGADQSVLVAGKAVVAISGDGGFKVKVDGRTPVLDVIHVGLAGSGTLSVELAFDLPHLEVVRLPKPLRFKLDLSVLIRWQDQAGPQQASLGTAGSAPVALFGQTASVALASAPVLDKTDLAVELLDQAGAPVCRMPWKAGKRPPSVQWCIGFADLSHNTFSTLKPENGVYTLGCRVVAARPNAVEQVLLSRRTVLRLRQPFLASFNLTFSPSHKGTYVAAGKIEGVDPGADLKVGLALVDAAGPWFGSRPAQPQFTSADPMKLEVIEATLKDDGTFAAPLGPGHFVAPPADFNNRAAYAILMLPAAGRTGTTRGPIRPYLNHDDTKLALWETGAPTWSETAPWVASEEAPLAARGQRPKSARKNVLAPPADLGGDPFGPLTREIAYADLRAWEGEIPHMYRDSAKEGYVTVGCGHKVDNADKAAELPFINKLTGAPATPSEKRAAFAQVMQEPRFKVASAYASRTTLVLDTPKMVELAHKMVTDRFVPELKEIYTPATFDAFPLCVRRALVDIAYNTGTGKMKKWKMTEALRAKRWSVAADELPNSREERKAWRRLLFMFAATLRK